MEKDDRNSSRSVEGATPLSSRGLFHQIWWLFLVGGAGLIVVGIFALVRSWESMDGLADVASITFLVDALLLYLVATRAAEWKGLYVVSGLVATAAVLVLVFFETREPFRFAMVLGGVLGWRGLIDVLVAWPEVSDFTSPSSSASNWVLLVGGALSILLGLSSVVSRGASIRLLFLVVCAYAVLRGVQTIAASSRLRALAS